MEKANLEFAKIVSTPTLTSWAQAYNAGNLFAVLSLKNDALSEDDGSLNILGKEIIDTLEKEYFATEEKNLASIKEALTTTVKKIPKGIITSLVVVAVAPSDKNILYAFIFGGGKIILKRGDKIGRILNKEDSNDLQSASGFLEDDDIIILETDQFANLVSEAELSSSLDHHAPSEIAETFSPKVHEKEEGGASALILVHKGKIAEEEIISEEEIEEEQVVEAQNKYFSLLKSKVNQLKNRVVSQSGLNHSKKIFLTVAILLLFILISSIFFAVKKNNEAKTQALFQEIFVPSQKKYDEGTSLLDLNKNLAREDFLQAKKTLEEGKSKFKADSKEEKQIEDLLTKVNKNLEGLSPEKIAANLDRTKITITVENGSGQVGVAGKASDFLKEKGYNVSSTGNADKYTYSGATIKVKSSASSYLDLLKKDLSEKYTISSTSSDLPKDSSTDAIIIVGK